MPQIPAGWEETTLGEFAIINPTESIKKGEVAKNIPMDFLDNFTRKISKYTEKEFSWGMKFRNWDTLFARITPCLENGKTAYVDILDDWEIAFWSTEYIVIREKKERSNSMFLYYLSVSPFFRDIAIKAMTWTSWRQRVQTDVLVNTKLHLPLLPEQQAIAAVLSSFDDKIELLRAENQTLEQMGQELFKERFGKWKVGDVLPEGWRVGKLGEMVDLLNGFSYKSSDFVENGKYRLVTIANVQDWNFIEKTKDSLDIIPEKMPDHCLLKTGDILLSLTWNVGRVCLIIGENYFLNQRVAKISPKNPIDYAYSYLYFRQKHMITLLESISVGTAQQNLSPIKTSDLSIIVPLREILDSFWEKANILVRKIVKNLEQIQTLSATRDQLLQKLMSGEVRVEF